MKRRLRAPSPALVISLIALFVALGGTSFAAINALPKNSVGSKQLKKNAVTGSKIKNGAVTAGKINTSGLTVPNATHATSADSATNATNATHATSATTATSATSATNATNAAVAASLKGVQYVVSSAITNGASSQNTGTEVCPAGMFVIGGGAFGSSGSTLQAINFVAASRIRRLARAQCLAYRHGQRQRNGLYVQRLCNLCAADESNGTVDRRTDRGRRPRRAPIGRRYPVRGRREAPTSPISCLCLRLRFLSARATSPR